MKPIPYARHRFPPDLIRHAVWLYMRFTLSYRDVEDLLAERGLDVSYETVRRWVLKFGSGIAANLRARRCRPDDCWHLDEMVVSINGRHTYLWRAVDSEGEVLDMLVQPRRNKAAALKLLRKLMKRQGFAPRVIVTDKLRSYAAALRDLGFAGRHDQSLRANNRAENSHRPIRRRERKMQGLQVAWISAALSLCSCRRLYYLRHSTPPALPSHHEAVPNKRHECMDRRNRSGIKN